MTGVAPALRNPPGPSPESQSLLPAPQQRGEQCSHPAAVCLRMMGMKPHPLENHWSCRHPWRSHLASTQRCSCSCCSPDPAQSGPARAAGPSLPLCGAQISTLRDPHGEVGQHWILPEQLCPLSRATSHGQNRPGPPVHYGGEFLQLPDFVGVFTHSSCSTLTIGSGAQSKILH